MDPTSWITPNRVTLARVVLGSAAIAMYASMDSAQFSGSAPLLSL